MTTFYVGPRPVLKGRNASNSIDYWRNEAGTYSNWELQNTEHILDGAPDNNMTLGADGKVRKPLLLEYLFSGGQHVAPMDGSGGGNRLSTYYFRSAPLEYKGLTAAGAFYNAGHAQRTLYYSRYSNFIFDGVTSADATLNGGHAHRTTAAWGGAFEPYIYKGASTGALANGGQAITNTAYGHNKVREWAGVTSAKAL